MSSNILTDENHGPTLVQSIENLTLISDFMARALTPRPFRGTQSLFHIGDFLASLPALALFLPIMPVYLSQRKVESGLILFVIEGYILVIAFGLVSFGKNKIIHILSILDDLYITNGASCKKS